MIGQTISHYRITEKLGEGGMGVVYKAIDLNLDRSVALKFLPPELTRDLEAKARFIHEAKAASALDHPNVCTVYEVNETGDGQLFMAMACYEGETLKEMIARGPLKLVEAMGLAEQIAEGLSKAHDKYIVHRDIKPANTFITNDGLVKILDFGLAKLAGQTKITQEGTTLGTVAYMSPEQSRSEEFDARTDLWSLGVVLYEMVVGCPPFQGDSHAAVIHSLQFEDPEPVTGLRTGVPLELERIIGKCLAKDPRERYQNADDLLVDLQVLKRLNIEQQSVPVSGTISPPRTPQRWPWVTGCVVVVLVAALLVVQSLRDDSASDQEEPTLAVMDLQDLTSSDDPVRAMTYATLLNVALIEDSPVRVVSSSYLQELVRRRFEGNQGAIASDQALEIAAAAGAELMLSGRIVPSTDGVMVAWELVDVNSRQSVEAGVAEGLGPAEIVDGVVAQVLPLLGDRAGKPVLDSPTSVEILTTASISAYRHYVAGLIAQETLRSENAKREFELAIAADSTFAQAYVGISKIYYGTSQGLGESRDLARHYAKLAWNHRSGLGVKDRLLLDAWRHHVFTRSRSSLDVYEELIIRYPDDTSIIKDYAVKLFFSWNHDQAIEVTRQGLAIMPEDFLLGTLNTSALRNVGRLEESIAACHTLTHVHSDEPNAWDELGLTQLARGQSDSARIAFELALVINPLFPGSIYGLALCDYGQGDIAGAVSRVENLTARSDVPNGIRFMYLVGWNELGMAALLTEAGRCQEALDVCETANVLAGTDVRNQQKPGLSRGIVRLQMWDYTGALKEIAEVGRLRGGPLNTEDELCFAEAKALIALGRFSEVDSVLSRVRGVSATGAVKYQVLDHILSAELALAREDPDAALHQLESVMGFRFAWHPWSIDLWMTTTRAYRMAGRATIAEAELKGLLGIYGGHALAHYELGKLYEEMSRLDEAEKEYTIFLDMWSNADNGLPQLEDAKLRLQAIKAQL